MYSFLQEFEKIFVRHHFICGCFLGLFSIIYGCSLAPVAHFMNCWEWRPYQGEFKMVKAKIYQPAKTAMQSGRGKSKNWVVEYPRSQPVGPDALMGWQSSADTTRQIKLRFPTQQAAIAYCEDHDIDYQLAREHKRKLRVKAYSDNFAFGRVGSWTH